MKKIYLASTSPRRKFLLEQAGLKFSTLSPSIDEETRRGELPQKYVERLATEKARVAAEKITHDNYVIIAGDTTVVLGKKIIGKPLDVQDAFKILKSLSGKTHFVYSGICVLVRDGKKTTSSRKVVKTAVTFAKLTDETIRQYIATGEPMDKAGAYGAQERGAVFVKKINGSWTNVVGLPMVELMEMLHPWLNPKKR